MLAEAAIGAMGLDIRRPDVAAIDFRDLAGSADAPALQLDGHSFPHLMVEHQGGLVGNAKVAGHHLHRLTLGLIAEDRNCREVGL